MKIGDRQHPRKSPWISHGENDEVQSCAYLQKYPQHGYVLPIRSFKGQSVSAMIPPRSLLASDPYDPYALLSTSMDESRQNLYLIAACVRKS